MNYKVAQKIQEWQDVESDMKVLKALELKLRKEICEELFEGRQGTFTVSDTIFVEGTNGIKVTASSKTTMALDEEMLDELALTDIEEQCIKYKASLVKSALNELDVDSPLWDCITEKPATPGLKAVLK